IKIRVYGEEGGIEWAQENPNTLIVKWGNKPSEIYSVGGNTFLTPAALYYTRTPAGHPEGFIEAFANIYRNFAYTVQAKIAGETPNPEWLDFPTVNDGLRGMQFIETVVKSGYENEVKWVKWVE
ncbi:MAG: gfo/Idh/MocA family oxidoreductase, partial [Prevotellaceae bacterium]|nr:gfo/Idh/MocA family oxidoreductase [Prevotellaceae bacterium]